MGPRNCAGRGSGTGCYFAMSQGDRCALSEGGLEKVTSRLASDNSSGRRR